MAYLNGNKVFLYGERTVDANLTTKTINKNGTYNASSDNVDGYSSVVVDAVPIVDENTMYFARVVDYDGTVIKMQWLNDGDEFIMPDPPSHDGLVFDEWACSQAIVNNKITIDKNNFIAAPHYYTSSGYTELDIELDVASGLTLSTVYLNDDYVDWGDGTISTTTGTKSHTYESYGKYTIKTNSGLGYYLFNNTNTTNKYNCVLRAVRYKNNVTSWGDNALSNSYKLQYITYPHTIKQGYLTNTLLKVIIWGREVSNISWQFGGMRTDVIIDYRCTPTFSGRVLNNCGRIYFVFPKTISSVSASEFFYSTQPLHLKYIPALTSSATYFLSTKYTMDEFTIPNSWTVIPADCFSNSTFRKITIPNTVTSIGNRAFYGCYQLREIVIPDSVTSIGEYLLASTYLTKVTFPTSITTIPKLLFFQSNYIMDITFLGDVTSIGTQIVSHRNFVKIDLSHCTTVPTLASSNAFSDTANDSKILVPSSLYNQWITETNWVSLASKIVPVDNT